MNDLSNVKYVVLMETVVDNKTVMKWGRCKTQEDVDDFIEIYDANYPNAHFEVYETNGCAMVIDEDTRKRFKK